MRLVVIFGPATPLRLAEKQPKRDIDHSRVLLLDHDARHRLNSDGDYAP